MKKTIFVALALLFSSATFSQVEITMPYKKGDINEIINITYSSKEGIDSVSIETAYTIYGKEHPGFLHSKTVEGTPSTIQLDYSLEQKDYIRTYRCLTYKKGQVADTSNEYTINYNGYNYDTTALTKVENLKYNLITRNDTLFIHLTWNKEPHAFAYAIGEKVGDSYSNFQLYFGGPMSKTTKTEIYIPTKSRNKKLYFAVGAINKPHKGIGDVPEEIRTYITVSIPE